MSKNRKGKQTGSENPMFGNGHKISGLKHGGADHTIYSFENTITKERFIGTRYDLYSSRSELDPLAIGKVARGCQKNHKGWIIC